MKTGSVIIAFLAGALFGALIVAVMMMDRRPRT